ncbi:TPA: transferrin-binding protein-like solute binding protein [Neisseria gonorrhoeae]
MNNPLVNQAAMVLPVFLLSACLGGGGSFDLDSVDTEAPRPAPKYQDVPSKKPEARKDQGGYGFAMRFKRRNWYGLAKEDRVKLNESDWEQTDDGNIKKPSKQQNIINALPENDGEALQDSSQEKQGISKVEDHHDFKYVWSGFFYKQIGNTVKKSGSSITEARNGPDGYIFYKGKDPSRELPVLGSVEYKGTWDFLTDVKANQRFTDLGNTSTKSGDQYSAFSGELDYIVKKEEDKKEKHKGLGLTTEITVDFGKKILNGKLIKNNYVINNNGDGQNKYTTEYYTLDATLRGNRFSGKATATDKKENETGQHPFVSGSSSLSGGFFGPQGEELGFRFLSDDEKVAVVGSAKTKDETASSGGTSGGASVSASGGTTGTPSENKLTTVLDAVELTPDGKEIKNLDNFSNAAQLVVDGIMIPLLPKPSEGGDGQADKGENGKTAFIYETTYTTTYTPESDKKDTKAQTGAGGMQTAPGAAGVNGGQAGTKTYKVQVCCSNLNYLKYGLLTRKTADNTVGSGSGSQAAAQTGAQSMFLQGERTDEKEIPKEQNVVYLGTWYGHIAANGTSWTGNASNGNSGNRAKFNVDFSGKKITGMLTAANRQEATFTIDAMIEGNGFKGTAKTGNDGFAPDQNSSTGTHKVHIVNAEVQGGFYGPNAEELGGWFAYPGNGQTKNAQENAQASSGNGNSAGSATVVFGAKRQRLVK